jgi:hypothetical protein
MDDLRQWSKIDGSTCQLFCCVRSIENAEATVRIIMEIGKLTINLQRVVQLLLQLADPHMRLLQCARIIVDTCRPVGVLQLLSALTCKWGIEQFSRHKGLVTLRQKKVTDSAKFFLALFKAKG